jgi:hypothetical protein
MVIDAGPRLGRFRLHEPARLLLAQRASGAIHRAGAEDETAREAGDGTTDEAAAVADAAARLTTAIASDPDVERDVAARGAGAVADQLVPIVTWAVDVREMSDADAVRVGVVVAGTRMLLGTPRRIVLAAVHELPAVLGENAGGRDRLDEIAIEVGLRLRRQRELPEDLLPS